MGFFQNFLGSAARQSEPSPGVRSPALFMSHPDVSHFLSSENPVITRSRACHGYHVSCPQQMDISVEGWRM